MNELKKYKFSELYEMSSGISSKPEQAGHGAPFCSFTTVFNNYFLPPELPDRMNTSVEEQDTYSLKEGDVLLTRTSETLNELGMSSVATKDYPQATFSGFLKRLRPTQRDVVYHKFLAFYLRSPLFRKAMNNNAVMTLRCSLNEQIFSYLDLLLPDFGQQKKIGDLLFHIYAKIELNNRINVELEGMAKLLYEYWFVQYDFPISAAQAAAMGKPHLEGKPYRASGGKLTHNETLKREIPDGWKVHDLGNILSIARGASPRPIDDFLSDAGIPWIKISDATASDNRFIFSTKQFILTEAGPMAKIVPPDTLILTNSATPAVPRITKIHSGVHDGWLVIGGYTLGLTKDFMFHYFCHERPRIICLGNGSIFKNLKTEYIKGLKIALPPDGIWKEASASFKLISDQIWNATQQNAELTALRDWLLPMLMNGQVSVA